MFNQCSYCIPQLNLVCWGGQPGLLLYTPANSGFMGWSARATIVYPSWLWFVGVVSQCSYCIPQPTLVHWSGQSGLLLYTQADSSSLERSVKVLIVYPSWLWFIWVVNQGSYCIPPLKLVCWSGQPGFLSYTPADSGLLGWSARAPIVLSFLIHELTQLDKWDDQKTKIKLKKIQKKIPQKSKFLRKSLCIFWSVFLDLSVLFNDINCRMPKKNSKILS